VINVAKKSLLIDFTFRYGKISDSVPLIPIRFIGSDGNSTQIINAIFDSGAHELTIPKDLADHLQYDIVEKKHKINTANGLCDAFSSKAHFCIGRGGREVEYVDEEICVMENCPAILMGIKPVFEDYLVIIDAEDKKIKLNVKKK